MAHKLPVIAPNINAVLCKRLKTSVLNETAPVLFPSLLLLLSFSLKLLLSNRISARLNVRPQQHRGRYDCVMVNSLLGGVSFCCRPVLGNNQVIMVWVFFFFFHLANINLEMCEWLWLSGSRWQPVCVCV